MSGNTYERAAIEAYWDQQENLCDPLTNVLLQNATLIPNWDKRREVQSFLAAHPELKQEKTERGDSSRSSLSNLSRLSTSQSRSVRVERTEEVGLFSLQFPIEMPTILQYRIQEDEFRSLVQKLNGKLQGSEPSLLRKLASTAAFALLCAGLTMKRPRSCVVSGTSALSFLLLCRMPEGNSMAASRKEAERFFREEFVPFFQVRGVQDPSLEWANYEFDRSAYELQRLIWSEYKFYVASNQRGELDSLTGALSLTACNHSRPTKISLQGLQGMRGLNFLAGMGLLALAAGTGAMAQPSERARLEEDTFWLLSHLLEDVLDPDFFGADVRGNLKMVHIGGLGMRSFILAKAKVYCPTIYDALGEEACSSCLGSLLDSWVLALFVGCAPHRLLEHLWDTFLGVLFLGGGLVCGIWGLGD
ncbi:trc [Symbiodinium natans]|uniref:Trc protein n=1 Tax=Symbiodinium natans TaxID=878477 RepID=A0A812S140_9DINO|nr:trc [Symbiodinium natans]